jgi:hypothetical protein
MLAAHFTTEIDRLWKGAELGITERLARKQERQRNRCGSGVQRSQGAKGMGSPSTTGRP